MNADLLAELALYQAQCLDEASGNVAWMGATTKDFEIIISDLYSHVGAGNYTNWKYPLFAQDNKCTFMDKDGKWLAHLTCSGMEFCPVCGFTGTPIFTLKGKVSS